MYIVENEKSNVKCMWSCQMSNVGVENEKYNVTIVKLKVELYCLILIQVKLTAGYGVS